MSGSYDQSLKFRLSQYPCSHMITCDLPCHLPTTKFSGEAGRNGFCYFLPILQHLLAPGHTCAKLQQLPVFYPEQSPYVWLCCISHPSAVCKPPSICDFLPASPLTLLVGSWQKVVRSSLNSNRRLPGSPLLSNTVLRHSTSQPHYHFLTNSSPIAIV